VNTIPVIFSLLFLITGRKKKWSPPFFSGLLIIGLSQLHWLTKLQKIPFPIPEKWLHLLSLPASNIVLASCGAILVFWGLARLFGTRDPKNDLARSLEHRRDYAGAAQLMMDSGHYLKARRLFQKAGDWKGAAEAAEKSGKLQDAAAFYRKSGGDSLASAITIYQRSGDKDAALGCRTEYAQWLAGKGRFDEAIEMWVRASDYQRGARIAKTALNRGRLRPSTASFRAAKKAATETRDHKLLAQLCELEEQWMDAGRFWGIAGEHRRAAAAYSRAGAYAKAADEEIRGKRPEAGANYLLESFRQRVKEIPFSGTGRTLLESSSELAEDAGKLIPLLDQLGRMDDLVEVLTITGHTGEAIEKLLAHGKTERAAELAAQSRDWSTAARIFEDLHRWDEASEAYEEDGQLEKAAQCAELAGEDARALDFWKQLNRPVEAARCLARSGSLEKGISLLHGKGMLAEAAELLRQYPGPVPDIPEIVLDMAEHQKAAGNTEMAIAILQRAVLGVALQPHRLGPALALSRHFLEIRDLENAQAQLDRILAFDYANSQAQTLVRELQQARQSPSATIPAGRQSGTVSKQPANVERYEIQHELGSGGMGVVYLARDTKLDRDIAIKVLRTTSEEEAEQLRNEAMVAATLNHPGIVTIFDFEEGFDGYFIAMEYVPGETLAKLLKEDRPRIQRFLHSILLQISDALAVAHENRVVHRDLKPANLLLTRENRVKILDFGIATRIGGGDDTGSVCGTPYYMAPEQIRGESPSPATDIYSLGATAYHLATGRPPFSRGNVIQAHLEQVPEDPCALNPDLDPILASIILQCLEKEPEKRFPNCRELSSSLNSVPQAEF